jgi:acetylglutamate kinase
MLFMTDVAGIYSRWPDQSSMIDEITVAQLRELTFADGMVPKVEAAINAISSGAASSRIFDGTSLGAFIDALEGRGGTWVRA